MTLEPNEIARRIRAGDRRALARLLTAIENGTEAAGEALAALYPHTGRAHVIGVTGAPGTGKSTLVTALVKAIRAGVQTAAVLAVDPSSPFTGGAILGDRIRMRDLSGDDGVFIRSMAARGELGGLASAARAAIRAFDAAGFDVVIVETVGAGQSEIAIARVAHTVIVVDAPGMGDEVQAIKAGILEIADILVVNKADRPGADKTIAALRLMLDTGHPASRAALAAGGHHHARQSMEPPSLPPPRTNAEAAFWLPPLVATIASTGEGVAALHEAIRAHRVYLDAHDAHADLERAHLIDELTARLREVLFAAWLAHAPADAIAQAAADVQARLIDPAAAVQKLKDLTQRAQR